MDVSRGAARCAAAMEDLSVEYYGLVGEGPWQEVLVRREPRTDGKPGMRLVSQEPTGVTYTTWREANQSIGVKNQSIARERYGR